MSESSTTPAARTGCGWRDGQDSAVPDSGRGVTDSDAHFRHVNNGQGLDTVHDLVRSRLSALSQCLPLQSYARLYAEVSVVVAAVGRQKAGWVDGMDGSASADPGRGVSNKDAHYQHIASGVGANAAHTRLPVACSRCELCSRVNIRTRVCRYIGAHRTMRCDRQLWLNAPPNFTLKLLRPGFGPGLKPLGHR